MGKNTVVYCVACIAIHRRDPTKCRMVLTCQERRERPRWGQEKRKMSYGPPYSSFSTWHLAFVQHAVTQPSVHGTPLTLHEPTRRINTTSTVLRTPMPILPFRAL